MEHLLLKLLESDSDTILQATRELNKVLKNPESLPALCQLLVTSTNPEVKQYAALIIKRRHARAWNWKKLPDSARTEVKKMILLALGTESVKSVRNSISQLIGVIVKHELPTNSWPEIINYVQQLVTSENFENKELGIFTLSIMTDVNITPNPYVSHVKSLIMLLSQTLNSLQDLGNPIAYYILKTMKNLVPLIEQDQTVTNNYSMMMPRIITTIQALAEANHEDLAIESFELLDELCDSTNVVIASHVKLLVHMCLAVISNKSLSEDLKAKAVTFIGWLVKMKKKALVQNSLVEPIVDMLFVLMVSRPDDSDEDYITSDNPILTSASLTLDMLAMHLPPEKLIPLLLRHIEPGLQSTDTYTKKASYVTIAILAEGCSDYIRLNYLEFFLRCICQGIMDSSFLVRNAALYALGQFSEHLQPEISEYSSELLPVLFEYFNQVCLYIKQEKREPHTISRMFYALEMFCENLHKKILPYLPKLMERLFEILSVDTTSHVKELALSAIGAAACASKEHMLPYLETIIKILNDYLTAASTDENMCLKIQALDTLGVVAKSIGESNFEPFSNRFLELGIQLLRDTDDPDMRKALYGLFAAMSEVMKKRMSSVLPEIVEYMLMSIRSSEGIVMHMKNDEAKDLAVYDDLSDNDSEEDIDHTDNEEDDIDGFTVDNAYIEEKAESVLALKEIAECTEEAFLPYLQKSFEEIFKLMNYPQDRIRLSSVQALSQFCINFSKVGTDEARKSLLKALSVFIPKLSELIRLNEEPMAVTVGFETYETLLTEMKSDVVLGAGHKDAIMNCIIDVMTCKTVCQYADEIEDDNFEAQKDQMIVDSAGSVLVKLGNVIPPEDFALCFQTVMPLLLKRLKNIYFRTQRSFAAGTIAECICELKHMSAAFVSQLLPHLLQTATQDSCEEVRSNCFFAIGEFALYGKEAVYPHYPQILQVLSHAIAKETDAAARDNVVGAIARLIITNYSNLPLGQVFPVFVQQLPLKSDFQEHNAVFKSILTLYQAGHVILQSHIPTLLKVAIIILHENKIFDDETKNLIVEFIKSAQRDFTDDWNAVYVELPQEIKPVFNTF